MIPHDLSTGTAPAGTADARQTTSPARTAQTGGECRRSVATRSEVATRRRQSQRGKGLAPSDARAGSDVRAGSGVPVGSGPSAPPTLIVLGGLPGAGKSTALRALAADPDTTVLDPEQVAAALRQRLPGVPYPRYRPLVHTLHALRVLSALASGRSRTLVVHATATRTVPRHLLAAGARWCGWRPVLVLLEVDPGLARAGQVARGRVLGRARNDGHRRRWARLRRRIADRRVLDAGVWARVVLTTRAGIGPTLTRNVRHVDSLVPLLDTGRDHG